MLCQNLLHMFNYIQAKDTYYCRIEEQNRGKCYARICYICLTIYKLKTHNYYRIEEKIEVNVMPEFATYV